VEDLHGAGGEPHLDLGKLLSDIVFAPLRSGRLLRPPLHPRYQPTPADQWHALIGEPTYADAVLDRLVHNAYRLDLSGESCAEPIRPKGLSP
jgi:hypothetical protein